MPPGTVSGAQPGNFRAFAEKIEKQTGLTLAYSEGDIELTTNNFPDIEGLDATQALLKVLDGNSYRIVPYGKHLIILKKPVRETGKEEPAYVPPASSGPGGPLPQPTVNGAVADSGTGNNGQTEHSAAQAAGSATAVPSGTASSGGTRLIVIREKGFDGKNIPASTTYRAKAQRTVRSGNSGIRAAEADSVAGPKTREFPFRWDLLESQAYTKAKATKKRRRKK